MRLLAVTAAAAVLAANLGCRSSRDYIAEGDRLFSSQKYADAILIYRKAVQKDPSSARAYCQLGLAYRARNENKLAFVSFQRAVTLDPEFEPAQIELGSLYLGDYLLEPVKDPAVYGKITAIADHLLAKDAQSYAALRLKGYLAVSDKKPDDAISFFTRAHAANPGQPDVVLGLTQGFLMAGRYQEAQKTAEDLIAKNKTFGPIYDVLYGYEMAAGHPDNAASWLKRKIANNPQNDQFPLQLAQHYWRTDRKKEAAAIVDGMLGQTNPAWALCVSVADFYKGYREWERAGSALDRGFAVHPEEKWAYENRTAEILALKGETKAAIQLLDRLLQQRPSDPETLKAHAILLLNSTERAGHIVALGEWQKLAQTDPGNPAVIFQLGRAYALTGAKDKARQQFETVIQKDSGNVSALLALAELSSAAKQFQQSLEYSRRILALEPAHRDARLLHATALVALGRIDQARSEYKSLAHDEPGFVEAQLQLAMLLVVEKRFAEGEKSFRQLYRPKTGDFRALRGLVEIDAAQGQWAKALGLLDTELGKFPDALPVRELLASTAVRAGKLDLAVQQYEQLLQRGGEDPEVLTELGQLYQRRHELNKSIAMLQKARDLAPEDWRAAARLGTVQQEAGLQPASKSNYEQAVRLGGDDADLLNNLAYLDADMGTNLDEALALARKALGKGPGNSQYADTVGFIYLKKKDFASALDVFQKLCQRYPADGGFRYHLGLALIESGHKEQGERELRAAVAADPALANQLEVKDLLGEKRR